MEAVLLALTERLFLGLVFHIPARHKRFSASVIRYVSIPDNVK